MASRPSSPTGFEMADAMSGLVLIDTNDLSKCGSPFARVPSLVLLDLTAHEKTTHNSAVNNDEINLEVDSDEEQVQEAFDSSTKEALHALFTEFDTSGDGHIDAKELLVFLHRLPEMAGMKLPTDFTVEEANLCMQGFDLDHNGTIEEEELMQWISDGLAKTAAERITFSLSSPFATPNTNAEQISAVAASLSPGALAALTNLGIVHERQNEVNEALSCFSYVHQLRTVQLGQSTQP